MLTVEIVNDGTGDEQYGNYRYRVLVNGGEVASGEVKKHFRPGGWPGLVQAVGKQGERDQWVRALVAFANFEAERLDIRRLPHEVVPETKG